MFFGHITPMEAYICQLLPSSKNFSSSELCLAVAVTAYYFSHLQDLFLASSFFFFFSLKFYRIVCSFHVKIYQCALASLIS